MEFTKTLNYLGTTSFPGRKDPTQTYHRATFLDTVDTIEVFVDKDMLPTLDGLKRMDAVLAKFNVGTSRGTSLRLLDVAPVQRQEASAVQPQPKKPGA